MNRIVISVILCAFALSAAAKPAPAGSITTQLPRSVRPSHYDVAIVPHAETLGFDGAVTITLDVLQPTTTITLQAIDLKFSKASLTAAGAKAPLAAPTVTVDAAAQTATFTFAKPLAPGAYRLALEYRGTIGTQATGLFAIDYDTAAGRKRALFTQFENSDARRMVPSWDEPAYKATFTLQATVPSGLLAASNMPVVETTPLGDGRSRVRFAESPKMSTYLLFFALGDFERLTAQADGTEVGVIVQKGLASQARFALETAQTVLHEYNDYFATPYPLPKLDNVASPGSSQFFGAMENWGAIFTFERVLLLDPSISTQADKQAVFGVAAHEISHMWFGDLVTMAWWDDLWLNEGFASWMADRTTAKLHPEWNSALEDVGSRDRAMARDAIATTHPVVQHIETVEQASQAFDAITYSKGAAVIRMLEGYVGADAWRTGVRRYIKAHAYGNTASDDLWRAIESATDKPVTAIAHDFTLQPGVPLIRVTAATCKSGSTALQLTQGEFTKDRPDKQPLAWRVPVIATTVGSAKTTRAVVSGGSATLKVPGCGAVIVNAGQSGYYRTLYGPASLAAIKKDFAKVAPVDQLGVMSDAWALGLAGLQPVSDYLDLAEAIPADADPQVWGDVAGTLANLNRYYERDAARRDRFQAFARARLSPAFERIGWLAQPGEPDPVTVLRGDLIDALSALDDPAVIDEARRRFAAQGSDPSAVPAALRRNILEVVARHADAKAWDQLHALAVAEKTPMVKDNLYALLAYNEDEALTRRALDLALTDEPGATNSAGMISLASVLHPDLAFDFAVAHLDQVDARVDSTSRSRFYPGLASGSLDPAMIDKVKAFAAAHVAASSRRSTDTAIANITYRMQVRAERLPAVDAWLEGRAAPP